MSDELKPCPKCGPHNLIRELSINDRVWVKCTSCTFTAWEEDWNARADGWISVDTRLPDDMENVITYSERRKEHYAAIYHPCGFFIDTEWEPINHRLTHWKPLPPPPKVTK